MNTTPAIVETINSYKPNPLIEPADIARFLCEDIGAGDLTAQLIPASQQAEATLITREKMVMCGQPWFNAVFQHLDKNTEIVWHVSETETVAANTLLATLKGNARVILTGERTALNLLQTLCATATQARSYAEAVAGTGSRILDTRKTLPGLRTAQKYAVRCGGGINHRMGLYDAVLIKENHILAAGSITRALQAAGQSGLPVPVEVEVENLTELEEALQAGAKRILLDNFSLEQLRMAVQQTAGRAKLEASGNVSLTTIRAIAETGVDFISVGSLTKDIQAIDLSLRVQLESPGSDGSF